MDIFYAVSLGFKLLLPLSILLCLPTDDAHGENDCGDSNNDPMAELFVLLVPIFRMALLYFIYCVPTDIALSKSDYTYITTTMQSVYNNK